MAGTRSGYQRTISLSPDDLDFVEPLPKHLVLECPICYCLLFNPHIVSCCGNHFCEHCLDRVKEDENPCPMCKSEFTSLRNKALQRDINQLEVLCPNSSNNTKKDPHCQWSGELGILEHHLNIGHRHGDCTFAVVGCIYGCGYSDKRGCLSDHELVCSKRPFSCDYCGEYESTCEDVTDRHWKECKMYPVECPNGCQLKYLARGKLREHLDNDCDLQVVSCKFSWADCDVRAQRLKLHEHLENSVIDHLEKLCTAFLELSDSTRKSKQENKVLTETVAQLQKQESQTQVEVKQLKVQNTHLTEAVDFLKSENDTLKQHVTKKFNESRAEQEVLKRRSFSLECSIGLPPFSFIMDSLQEHLRLNTVFFSPPFYSRIGGYRFRIKVTPNGIFFGEGTHISLTIYIMKGVFDDYLRWPFRGNITVALLDQLNDVDHKFEMLTFDKGTSIKASGRVLGGDINEKGLVMYEFFDHAWLKPNSKKRKVYVKDDKLLFKVVDAVSSDTI